MWSLWNAEKASILFMIPFFPLLLIFDTLVTCQNWSGMHIAHMQQSREAPLADKRVLLCTLCRSTLKNTSMYVHTDALRYI